MFSREIELRRREHHVQSGRRPWLNMMRARDVACANCTGTVCNAAAEAPLWSRLSGVWRVCVCAWYSGNIVGRCTEHVLLSGLHPLEMPMHGVRAARSARAYTGTGATECVCLGESATNHEARNTATPGAIVVRNTLSSASTTAVAGSICPAITLATFSSM